MKLGTQVGLGPGHNVVLDGDPAPLSQKGTAPQFSAHACCGQMAEWIKMPLGKEVGLGPRPHCVRWGSSSLSPKVHSLPFQSSAHACCGETAGWIKMPLGREVGLSPGHVLDGDPPLPLPRGHSPNFWPMSIVAKRLPISTTAEHLLDYVVILFDAGMLAVRR